MARHVIERDAELVSLGQAVGAAARGEGGVVSITGPAGVDKTSLLRA